MGVPAKLTIDVTANLAERLDRLSTDTRRSQAALLTEAVEAYVERELHSIERIRRGLEDMAAGRVTSHAEVTRRAEQIVAEARLERSARR